MTRLLARIGLLTIAVALGTAFLGWWAVPAIGLAWGLIEWRAPTAKPVITAALAAGLAWDALLIWSGIVGPIARLASRLGGVMGMPGWVLLLTTLIYPVVLASAAATAGSQLGRFRPRPEL